MVAVTICSDLGAQIDKVSHCFHCFPSICYEVMELDAMILVFWMLSFKPTFSLSSFTFIKRLFSSSSLSAIRVVSSQNWGYWYFSQQSWFQLVLHPAWHFAWCILHICLISRVIMYIVDVLLFQFGTSLFSMSSSNVASWPAYRFLRRQARWCDIPISLRIFCYLLWSTQSKPLA